KEAEVCKVNSVAFVKQMMSPRLACSRRPLNRQIPFLLRCECEHNPMRSAKKKLDSETICNIIVFTNNYGRFASDQTTIPPPAGSGASAINCWWDQVKDLININLQLNLASTILLWSKSLGITLARRS